MAGIINEIKIDRKDILIFIIGLFSLVKVRVLGTLGVSELMCFGLYFLVANPFCGFKHKGVTQLFFASLLWLVGVFISDRYNGTNMVDSLKGFFNVFFVLGLIPFVFWALYDKPHRMLYFWIGNAISSLFAFYIQKSINLDEIGFNVWRVYAWYYPFIVFSGVLYYKGKTIWACLIIEAFAVWSLFHLSRNIFLTVTISVCVILFINSIKKKDLLDQIDTFKHKSVKLFFVLAIAFVGIYASYEFLASSKILGERVYTKYHMQKHSKFGLASGRGDFLQSVYLVSKKPLLGYGSYAKNTDNVLKSYYKENSMNYNAFRIRNKVLPGHSYLMGGWVFAGILGMAFWAYIIFLIAKYFREGLLFEKKLVGINVLLTFAMLWNIFFSPFADRLNFLFYIILVIITLKSKDHYVRLSNKNNDSDTLV